MVGSMELGMVWLGSLQFAPAFKGAAQSQFISKFEPASGRQSMGNAGDADRPATEAPSQVMAGGVAFDIASQCENELPDGLRFESLLQGINAQILGSDSIERAQSAAENMVASLESAGFFKAEDIEGPFNEAKDGAIAGFRGADGAGLGFREGGAALAEGYSVAGAQDGFGESLDGGRIGLDEVKGQALGRTRTDARQAAERARKLGDRFGQGGGVRHARTFTVLPR